MTRQKKTITNFDDNDKRATPLSRLFFNGAQIMNDITITESTETTYTSLIAAGIWVQNARIALLAGPAPSTYVQNLINDCEVLARHCFNQALALDIGELLERDILVEQADKMHDKTSRRTKKEKT